MANEEALGPRKTAIVAVIVVGCFAVLWPRILSPMFLGPSREQLKPNQYDRDAGCCEVMFATEVAVMEVLNAVCGSLSQADGKLSPYAAAECRKTVNETCGVDIQAFLKRSDNVGKTTKGLLDMMKASNSSCLKEHFGVPVLSLSTHTALNSWMLQDTLKQERAPIRSGGAHPALRERGRAIPAAAFVAPPAPRPAPLPPHVRVRSSPLQGYFEIEIKPPPIPGMRPPLGSPGGPVAAPKSSMGLVMPIYTICIIVFFVYTLSKILFKRTAAPYDHVSPDPQFRRKVFRDESRTSPDKLVVTAISGLVAEVQQQMEASYAQNQQRQDLQDNHARPYTNGTIIHSGPVQIVASEYREPSKEKSPIREEPTPEPKEPSPEPKEPTPEPTPEKDPSPEPKDLSPEPEEAIPELKELTPEPKEPSPEPEEEKEPTPEEEEISEVEEIEEEEEEIQEPVKETDDDNNHTIEELKKITGNIETLKDSVVKLTEDFLNKEKSREDGSKEEKKSTPELLEEALQEDELENPENATVKVMGMELRAHAADGGAWPLQPPAPPAPRPPQPSGEVKSIFLETEIPQQSRVLVAEFGGAPRPDPSSLVVSGKMTLSLIQDEPRETPERDPESTMDDFTTASAMTQPAAEPKDDDLSDEEIEEEIEIEEIEEEVDEEEEELENDEAPKETGEKKN